MKRKILVTITAAFALVCFSGCSNNAVIENSSGNSSYSTSSETSSSSKSSSEGAVSSSTTESTQSSVESTSSSESTSSAPVNSSEDLSQISGIELTQKIKVGWNIGNSFDASDCHWVNDEMLYESAWNGEMNTETHIQMLKDAGFNAVRVPVSWHNHVSDNYSISEKWLNRVNEVVDWCLERDMFVILNIHHDNSTSFMFPTNQYLEQSKNYISAIWRQLAFRFKDYDERLIFEIMNEPRLIGHNNEWWIDENNADCKQAIQCINEINQVGVNTIRAAGGYNKTRFIMCPGYDASADGALNAGYVLPSDPVDNNNHIIVSVHAYTPYEFALQDGGTSQWSSANQNDLQNMTGFMDKLYEKYVSKGTAVIIGEFGARNKNNNTSARADFAKTYVSEARKRGIPCFWWDNNAFSGSGELFGILDRKTSSWYFPEIKDGLVNG
ncbi:MAG: glycoside hydrolase family 5 protein [Oscillospiraceae bacterium]|nr:glycoside hydrolase family 5 protein [Oscillospiraceae bacterium]